MDEALWSRLTRADRDRADRLIVESSLFAAIRAVFEAVTPRPPLPDCRQLVLDRLDALRRDLRRDPPPGADLPAVRDRAAALPVRPSAIRAVWRGERPNPDVLLLAVLPGPLGEVPLSLVRHRDNLDGFSGRVPPWPAASAARRLGVALADHLAVPFHFPSPDRPDRG
jgi:hypothetical protein